MTEQQQRATELWAKYKIEPTDELRKALIAQYLPLVWEIVSKMGWYGRGYDYQDLVQFGCIGLIQAIDRHDPNYGVSFQTYARRRIRGAVVDAIRSATGWRRTYRPVVHTYSDIWEQTEQFVMFMANERGPESSAEQQDEARITREAVLTLSPRLQYVIQSYYLEGQTQPEIGKALGITESRVHQLRDKALVLLRKTLVDSESRVHVEHPRLNRRVV